MGRCCYECLGVHLYVWLLKFHNVTVFKHPDISILISLSMHGFPWDITITSHLPEHRVGDVSRKADE